MELNLPTYLTLLRIVLIPVLVILFYLPWKDSHAACALVFMIAGLTDWLDGYLARRLNQTSAFGAFLDPVADKLMVAAALIMLVQINRVNAIVAVIIIGREIAISALREWMAKLGQGRSLSQQQALDVAAYLNLQIRPADPRESRLLKLLEAVLP